MDPVCVDCGEPIEGEVVRFGGSPIHPECLERLSAEMDATFPPEEAYEVFATCD